MPGASNFLGQFSAETLNAFMVKVGGGGPPPEYREETLAYETRVEADGGTIVSLDAVDTAYALMELHSLTPKAWHSAQFGYKDDGSGVTSKLYDLSENNNDLTAATTARPTWTAALQNGKAGIVFDGSANILLGSAFAATNYTLALVSKLTTAANTYRRIYHNGSSYGFGIAQYNDQKRSVLHGNVAWNNSTESITTNTELVIAGYNGTLWERVNSVDQTIGSSAFSAPDNYLSLGSGVGEWPFPGYIFEAIAFDNSVSSTIYEAIEAYINDQWAIY